MIRGLPVNREATLVTIVSLVEAAEDGIAIAELAKRLEMSFSLMMTYLYTLYSEGVLIADSFQIVRVVGLHFSAYFGCFVEVRFCPHCHRFTNQATNEHGDWGCLCCEKIITKEEVEDVSACRGN